MGLTRFYTEQSSVSKEVGTNIINVYAWMVQNFMPEHDFPREILYPVSEDSFFSARPAPQREFQSDWIQAQFLELKDWCKMSKWSLSFVIEPDYIIPQRIGGKQQNLLVEVHSNGSDEKYYVDDYGRPVFYYDKYKLLDPGYINYRIIKRLADQLHKTATKSLHVSTTPNQTLYLISGAFLGLGHLFCAKNDMFKEKDQQNQNVAAFALAVYFNVRGMSKMRAYSTCGHLMSKQTKRDLKIAFKQLKKFKVEMQDLRNTYQKSITIAAA